MSLPSADPDIAPFVDRRGEKRFKIFLRIQMSCEGSVVPVHLLNISRGGGLGHAVSGLQANTPIAIHWRDGLFFAKVRWVRNGLFGLSFVSQLSAHELDVIVNSPLVE